jgi:hypothetical protein
MSIDYMDKEYASDQLMTEDEQKQLEEISEKYTKAFEKKQEELGCEENLEENNDLGLDSLLLDDDFDLDFDLGGEAITGTKEYKDSVEALAQMTAILDNIKTCEDYNNSMAQWEAISNEMDKRIPLYTEEERMTKEEQNDVRERALEFFNRSDQISRALCK